MTQINTSKCIRYFKKVFLRNSSLNKIKKNTQKFPLYSYGNFCKENPNATRKERQEAVKRFYESTKK